MCMLAYKYILLFERSKPLYTLCIYIDLSTATRYARVNFTSCLAHFYKGKKFIQPPPLYAQETRACHPLASWLFVSIRLETSKIQAINCPFLGSKN